LIIWWGVGSWFVHVTVVPCEIVTIRGLKAKSLMATDTLVWFNRVAVTWGAGVAVFTGVAMGVAAGVAGSVSAGVGATVAWVVGWVVDPSGVPVHPAMSTARRSAMPRIGNLVCTVSKRMEIPHGMMEPGQ
jgi:hypothetical protein